MYVHALGHSPRFADRVAKMLERVEHRPAMCQADRKAAYRLRYEAYLRENLLNQRLDAMLYDEVYDASPNSLTTVTYVDGELASTVRVHVITDKEGVSPARDVFPDVVTPYLRAQRVIIDPSRPAARAYFTQVASMCTFSSKGILAPSTTTESTPAAMARCTFSTL